MPRRNPVCIRCGRRPTYDELDAWIATERAPNSMPTMYQRRWCTMCITPGETAERRVLLARREEQRQRRRALENPLPVVPVSPVSIAIRAAPEIVPEGGLVTEHGIVNEHGNVAEQARTAVPIPPVRYDSFAVTTPYDRRFGVEIEFVGERSVVARACTERGEVCEIAGYGHERRSNWRIVSDASITGPGGELVSPVLHGSQGLASLTRVCAGLEAAGGRINRSCGLHIHHEIPRTSDGIWAATTALVIYARNWELISAMVAPSRRTNHYCLRPPLEFAERFSRDVDEMLLSTESVSWSRFTEMVSTRVGTRYLALNLVALTRHGTVEFRQHQGTTSARQIAPWIRFGQALLHTAHYAPSYLSDQPFDSHQAFFSFLNLSQADTAYWMRRIAFFQRRRPVTQPEDDPESDQERLELTQIGLVDEQDTRGDGQTNREQLQLDPARAQNRFHLAEINWTGP